MTTPRERAINPEVVLEAANIAEPGRPWGISSDGSVAYRFGVSTYDDPLYQVFSLTDDSWARKLERALKKEGWQFGWYVDHYYADRAGHKFLQDYASDTLLLLKCVSAQCGKPLYIGEQNV